MLSSVGRLVIIASTGVAATALGDFLPPNDLHLEDYIEAGSGISEAEFNRVINEAIAIYDPIIKTHGGKLSVARNWTNSTVNASASRFGATWTVAMYGGLARRPEVTSDGFAMVLCHEIGHHLAGFPGAGGWASNEGQSDYFSTHTCAELLWADDPEGNAKAAEMIPEHPKALCDQAYFADGVDRMELCYRGMLAGYSAGSLLGALGGDRVAYNTPDASKVARTNHSHPRGQCRLDTYMAGALCARPFDTSLIPGTERAAADVSCHTTHNDVIGTRPLCWFKPGI